ncbi:ankyrin repeat-containing domain protein [Microdochium trichocladiopsis]|uniref:Ankyrin repeat-containing domain protein n=1 Tax=Microdochium trichocladiopsis TaxID=1682393 RepID=A0A9P9BKW5_9PEZI|nr:ankyrin repeat-containing domain protein [Microdochium trichocladiopsis]KAH7012078.1 ankyrin repeat-containing domain protein [Microdochium trichocladiopsis]
MTLGLLSLPSELLHLIVKFLDRYKDISALCRAHRSLHPYLYQHDARYGGAYALFYGALTDNEAIITTSLRNGAGVNTLLAEPVYAKLRQRLGENNKFFYAMRGSGKYTALICAVICNHYDAAKLLLDNDSSVDCYINKRHSTPLHLAARFGHASIVELLLRSSQCDYSTFLNGEVSGYCTPLYFAISELNVGACRALLEHGAVAELQRGGHEDDSWRLMLDCIAVADDASFQGLVELLGKYQDWETSRVSPQALLCAAARKGNLEKVRWLLDQGLVRVDNQEGHVGHNSEVSTLLIEVAFTDKVEVMRYLLEAGADARKQREDGWTALMEAAEMHNRRTVVLLLQWDRGLINMTTENDETALHVALGSRWRTNSGSFMAVIKAMIEHGADLELQTSQGLTPLLTLLQRPHSKTECQLLRYLLDANADATAKCNRGETALYYADSVECSSCAELLSSAIKQRSRELKADSVTGV